MLRHGFLASIAADSNSWSMYQRLLIVINRITSTSSNQSGLMGVLRNKTLQFCCVVKTYHPTFQADGHNTPHSANLHPNLGWTNHHPIRCNKSQHQTYMNLPDKRLQNTKIQDLTAHMFHPHIFTVIILLYLFAAHNRACQPSLGHGTEATLAASWNGCMIKTYHLFLWYSFLLHV